MQFKNIRVRVMKEGEPIVVEVEHNGVGFDVELDSENTEALRTNALHIAERQLKANGIRYGDEA